MGEVSEQNALNKYIMAGFYEEHNLFIDAIAAYEEAIKLAPDVPTYQEGYEEFLLRHGLKQPQQ
jgi:cytochrome c-type biogenesis protein CcmH/NrfG